MICKLNFGSGFQGCLDYITGKYDQDKHTKILAHSSGIPDMDNKTVAQIFDVYAEKGGHDIGKPVGHFAYSFHPDEASRISDDFMMKIVREHMELLGIRNTEWIFGRHYDTDHEHGHLMFSMIDKDGNVISDSMIYERNKRICKYLTKKYGLMMSSDKEKVNRDKLRGKEKLKYEFYDKVMKCKLMSSTWQEFDKALKAEGMKLRFHYNNVTGKLMGVAFTDGKVSFSGNKLDPELKLDSLIKEFGDLKQIAHESVHDWYEDYQMQLRYINDWNGFRNLMKAHPEWKDIFPNKEVPSFQYLSVPNLLDRYVEEDQEYFSQEHTPSEDGHSGFIGLELLCAVLLQPYQPQLSMGGGGGGGNNRGWRDLDDDEKNKHRFHLNFNRTSGSKPSVQRKR